MFLSYNLPRSVVRISGQDRVKHLHSFCTADIRAMQPGDIREAMVLDTKGKLKCLVHVLCREDSLELNAVPGQALSLISHLDMYVIREDVRFEDCSDKLRHTFFLGDEQSRNGQADPAWSRFQTVASPGGESTLCQADFAGPGFLLQNPASDSPIKPDRFADSKAGTEAELHLHRIACSCPWFGIDCDQSNLPQELQRDAQAISFTKGCYLGQETVARIDALGRVNQLLVVLRSNEPEPAPAAGTELKSSDQSVGKLTSIATDPATGHWIGLAIVKRKAMAPGAIRDCEIVAPQFTQH